MASRLFTKLKVLFVVVLCTSGIVYAQNALTRSVTVDGTQRQLLVYLPQDFQPSESLPVLFCFHGGDDFVFA